MRRPPQKKGTRRARNSSPAENVAEKENLIYSEGISFIAGIDEAGRGPLAGPVVASAVILPKGLVIQGLRDSKQLAPARREELFEFISREAVSVGVGIVGPDEIDRINIHNATLKAMRIAVEGLSVRPDHLLIDGSFCIDYDVRQEAIVRGDEQIRSIAAASVIAKVTRDRMMVRFEAEYPMYSFSIHKGYGTKRHFEEIRGFGPTQIHRKTFLKNLLGELECGG
jgi:ribonuclease HII